MAPFDQKSWNASIWNSEYLKWLLLTFLDLNHISLKTYTPDSWVRKKDTCMLSIFSSSGKDVLFLPVIHLFIIHPPMHYKNSIKSVFNLYKTHTKYMNTSYVEN